MERTIFLFLYELTNLVLYLTLFMAIKLIIEKKISKNFSYLFVYLIVTTLLVVYSDLIFFKCISSIIFLKKIKLFFPSFHFIILGLFVCKWFKNRIYKNHGNIIIYFFTFLLFVGFLLDLKKYSYYSVAISNLGLIILCSFYYYSHVITKVEALNYNSFSFISISGIFISSGASLPVYLFTNIIDKSLSEELFFSISIIAPLSSLILYLFFFKSFLCLKHQKI